MNVTMNVECSPEEARRLMGLPDLGPIHDLYLDKLRQAMTEGVTTDMLEAMMRTWSPVGDAGMAVWRSMLENMSMTPKG